jgi:hypothetical protein
MAAKPTNPILKLAILLVGIVGVSSCGLLAYLRYGPRTTPVGQPPMVRLKPSNFSVFVKRFNTVHGEQRMLVMLSPTCPVCLAGASALQRVLREHPRDELKVFVVWEPVLMSDLSPPSSSKLARLSDPRVEQFWDSGRLLSKGLLALARAHPDRLGAKAKQQLLKARVVWDFVALYPPAAFWRGQPPVPEYYGAPIVEAIDGLRAKLNESKNPVVLQNRIASQITHAGSQAASRQ